MADLDYMVRSNTADTSAIPNTGGGTLDHAFANSVKTVGTAVTYSAGTFTLVDAGLYLVTWSDEHTTTDTTNNERLNWKTELIQGGSAVIPGRASGYIRKNSGAQDYRTSGMGIISSAGSESLLIRSTRFDNSTTGTNARVVNQGTITVLKLSDADSYGRYSQSANTAAVNANGTEADIAWNTTTEEEGPFTRTANAIDIDTSGRYLVAYTVPFDGTGSGARNEFTGHLELDSTEVPGTRTETYVRTSDNSDDGCLSWAGFIDVTANEDLVLRHTRRDGESTSVNYLAGSCLQIWQLPAGNECAIAEATSDNFNTAGTNQLWDTNPHLDTAGFDYATGVLSTDAAVGTDDYLAFFTQAVTSVVAATRAMPAGELRVGTTDKGFGGSTYNRNSGAGWGAINGGGILDDVAQGTNLHVRNNRIGTNTTTMTCGTGQLSVLRLGSLVSGPTDYPLACDAGAYVYGGLDATLAFAPIGASWLAAEDTDYDGVNLDTPFRLRHRLEVSAADWTTPTIELWARKNADPYFQVTTTSTGGVELTNSASAHFVDGDDITEALLSGTGSLIANNNGVVESSAEISGGATVTVGNFIETEHAVQFPTGDAVNNDVFTFRLRDGAGVEFTGTYVGVAVTVAAGTTAYTLTCDAGAYVYTGNAVTDVAAITGTIELGAYAYSGLDPTQAVQLSVAIDLGTYTYTGIDPTITTQRTQSITLGTYAHAGLDVDIDVGYGATIDLGTYTYSGLDPTVTVQWTQAVDLGTYTYAGLDPTLSRGQGATIDLGTYTYAGLDPTVSHSSGVTIILDAGVYTYSGQDPALSHSISIALDAGSYTYAGLDPTISAQIVIETDTGAYTYTGLDPDLVADLRLEMDAGAYTYTGLDPDLVDTATLITDAGAYSLTGLDPTLTYAAATSDDGVRRGGSRKKYWWEEDRFYLPPHKKKPDDGPLPHEAAIEDAKQELRNVRATNKAEHTKLAGALGNITKSAKALERKIQVAEDVAEVSKQYRALGDRITNYIDRINDIKLARLKADDEDVMLIILELD